MITAINGLGLVSLFENDKAPDLFTNAHRELVGIVLRRSAGEPELNYKLTL